MEKIRKGYRAALLAHLPREWMPWLISAVIPCEICFKLEEISHDDAARAAVKLKTGVPLFGSL